ncbi:MAG: precorrin-6y C5,15-methyltransferase (decarboxylating) subunit CbiE [Chloroflexota bacterium]
MPGHKVWIIGVGPGGADSLTTGMRRRVTRADIVCGGQRLLDMFPALSGEKVAIGGNLKEIVDLLKANRDGKRVVVLASGDPGFFGIAGYLTGALGKGVIRIVPNVSAMQLAFARIGESWDGAALVSVHARPIEDIIARVRDSETTGIFTDAEHSPAVIARALLDRGIEGYRAYVCENLGKKTERITRTGLRGLLQREFSPLNTLILVRDNEKSPPTPRAPGIPDREFYQRKPKEGLITKQEVRAVSLAKLRIGKNDVVWDIGAGSGAVSVEASFLAGNGHVYAVEKNTGDVAIIRKNLRKFRADNVTVVPTFAPDGLDTLPEPTAVFIGGSGGRIAEIIAYVARRLRPGGRVVVNLVGLENLSKAAQAFRDGGFPPEITLVNIARSTDIGELTRMAALNPVFILSAEKKQ